MRNLLIQLKRLSTAAEQKSAEPHWLRFQLLLSAVVIAIAFSISASTLAGYLGASAPERAALALAGLIYGLVGARYVIDFILRAAWRTSRPWLRKALLSLTVVLLGGPTIIGFGYLALNSSSDASWHSRLMIFGLGVALAVAGYRELMAISFPRTGGEAGDIDGVPNSLQ